MADPPADVDVLVIADVDEEIEGHGRGREGAEDAVRLTANPKDKTTLLRLWRQGGSRFLVVDESNAG